MVNVEITGYKKIEKPHKTLYYLSAISLDTPKECVGIVTYNAFVSDSYLKKHGIKEASIIGAKGNYYNVKQGNAYKQGISFKK